MFYDPYTMFRLDIHVLTSVYRVHYSSCTLAVEGVRVERPSGSGGPWPVGGMSGEGFAASKASKSCRVHSPLLLNQNKH